MIQILHHAVVTVPGAIMARLMRLLLSGMLHFARGAHDRIASHLQGGLEPGRRFLMSEVHA